MSSLKTLPYLTKSASLYPGTRIHTYKREKEKAHLFQKANEKKKLCYEEN